MNLITELDHIFESIWERKFQFFGVFMLIVTLTYGVLFAIDFIPEAPDEVVAEEEATEEEVIKDEPIVEDAPIVEPAKVVGEDATPNVIILDSLGGKKLTVLNPESATVAALDNALLSGVVRHPQSADLLHDGTMLILGHSSYLPVVHNKNFQAFNGIQDLKWGDKIRLQSSDLEYIYRIERVYKAKASTDEISLEGKGKRLIIATCNSFGTKDDRFIIEAILIDTRELQ